MWRHWGKVGPQLSLLFVFACGEEPTLAPAVWFTDNSSASRVGFMHDTGAEGAFYFREVVGSGVCLLDFDSDGYLDLYFVQSASPEPDAAGEGNRLYRNLGDFGFEDVTESASVGDSGYGMGCTTGDYDDDGHVDMYVSNLGPNVLYRNLGDGSFEDVTTVVGVDGEDWGTSAAFIDLDDDGRLDLFVVNYIHWNPAREIECHVGGYRDYCSPNNYRAPAADSLYRNTGSGFEEVSVSWGLGESFGNGLGLVSGDLDLDGRFEVYVANDGMENQLWSPAGTHRLEERAIPDGVAVNADGVAEAGMGVALGDIDDDGDPDLFLTHLEEETNTLYLNQNGVFDDRTARSGLAAPSLGRTGFGVGFADFDLDGILDLYVANGRVKRASRSEDPEDVYAQANQLFRGLGDGRFEEVPDGGTNPVLVHTSRGAAFGDLDNDGDVDVVVSNRDGPPYLLRNRAGGRRSWVLLRVLDGGRDAIGARVRIDAGDRMWWRWVQTAYSYASANDPRVHVGLGEVETVDRVTVFWPGGLIETFGPLPAREIHEIVKGAGVVIGD